jgi:serine/threonine-protein kinase
MELLLSTTTELLPAAFLARQGEVFAVFDRATQDSGNISYGIRSESGRFFVKTAGMPDDPAATLLHRERIEVLHNAARINRAVSHPAVPPLRNVIESPAGPLLVYDWVDGELLGGVTAERRADETSAFARFRRLPVPRVVAALDSIYSLHTALAAAGWIAVDFYDGSLIYDFSASQIHVVDMDLYRTAPFVNGMGRMFGSTRFMAPEELTRGARIDQRTNVFTMGRTALQFLSDGTDDPRAFRGSPGVFDVVMRACRAERRDRFATMAEFHDAWRGALTTPRPIARSDGRAS